jgi:hypothetical protein
MPDGMTGKQRRLGVVESAAVGSSYGCTGGGYEDYFSHCFLLQVIMANQFIQYMYSSLRQSNYYPGCSKRLGLQSIIAEDEKDSGSNVSP